MRLPDCGDQRHQAGTKVLNSAAIYRAEAEDPKLLPRRASAVVEPKQILRVLKPRGCYAYINYAHADMRMVFCTQDVLGWGSRSGASTPEALRKKSVSQQCGCTASRTRMALSFVRVGDVRGFRYKPRGRLATAQRISHNLKQLSP